MNVITNIKIIDENIIDGKIYGVYIGEVMGHKNIFIRNGNSVGRVSHYPCETLNDCVVEINSALKDDILELKR